MVLYLKLVNGSQFSGEKNSFKSITWFTSYANSWIQENSCNFSETPCSCCFSLCYYWYYLKLSQNCISNSWYIFVVVVYVLLVLLLLVLMMMMMFLFLLLFYPRKFCQNRVSNRWNVAFVVVVGGGGGGVVVYVVVLIVAVDPTNLPLKFG